MEPVQRWTAELVRDLESKSCVKKCLRELGMFSLKKRMLRGDLVALYNHLKKGCEQVRVGVFHRATKDRTRGNGLKLHWERFSLNIRRNFFTEKVVRHWKGLSRLVVESPPLEAFQEPLDMALSALVWLTSWRSVKG